MKKTKTLLTGLLAALLLGGCGGSDSAPAASAPEPAPESVPAVASPAPASESVPASGGESEPELFPAPDFELVDQYGTTHRLSDYRGKVVFLNFWATWCGPCRDEMPDIEQLYQDHGAGGGEVIVLGVAMPLTEENKRTSEGTAEEVAAFLSENGYTYPTLMDTTGEVFEAYYISAFPTTFMVTKEGNLAGYVSGTLPRATMDAIIEQTEEISA